LLHWERVQTERFQLGLKKDIEGLTQFCTIEATNSSNVKEAYQAMRIGFVDYVCTNTVSLGVVAQLCLHYP
jgi:hypothetical protein